MGKVLLVNMPFADIRRPSLALSLLKSTLSKVGIVCDTVYLNVAFQAYIGQQDIYRFIAQQTLLGDWLFSGELFGSDMVDFNDRLPDDTEGVYRPLFQNNLKSVLVEDELLSLRSKASLFIEQCLYKIKWNNYSIIGFTSQFAQQVASLAMAKRIKERWPDKIMAFGGSSCEGIMGEALLRLFSFVDWVFNGQADLSFPRAVIQWFMGKPPEGVPGVAYREHDRIISQGCGPSIDLNRLPYPDFDDYFIALNKWAPTALSYSAIPLEFSRGCWWGKKHHCAFCGLNREIRSFRSKNPKRVEEEVRTTTNHYGVYKVYITDSVIDNVYFETLLPNIAKSGNIENLFLECRSSLTREQAHILRRAGARKLQAGIESLDTEILSRMRKGTTLLQNVQFLKLAREYGIFVGWHILYGLPGEKRESYRRMTSVVPLIVHLNPPLDMIPVRLQRFSPLFVRPKEWGIKDIKACADYRLIYPFNQLDVNDLAFFFDFDFEGKDFIPEYARLVMKELQPWWECWNKYEPPLLAFELRDGKIVIYDTRPCRLSATVELKGEVAIAYRACDTRQLFDCLANKVRKRQKQRYCGDTNLRNELDELVERRLMLREGDWYLSLANDLEILNEHDGTALTYLMSPSSQ